MIEVYKCPWCDKPIAPASEELPMCIGTCKHCGKKYKAYSEPILDWDSEEEVIGEAWLIEKYYEEKNP